MFDLRRIITDPTDQRKRDFQNGKVENLKVSLLGLETGFNVNNNRKRDYKLDC